MVAGVSLLQVLFSAALLFGKGGSLKVFSAQAVPWMLGSAVLGVVIMLAVSTAIGSIGTLQVYVLLILGQMIISTVIDHFGLFGSPRIVVNPQKLASIVLIAAGVIWFVRSSS
ncbi:hypothetical protein D3C75_758320 [compost metagenome]